MFQTEIKLINTGKIDAILKEIVLKTYEEALEEKLLLCMECGDVDFYIVYSNNEELQDAINENFEIDEYGEIMKIDEHQELMDDLFDYFLIIHKESDLFDFFQQVDIPTMGKFVNRIRICWRQRVYIQLRLKMR
ncbi:hypothetical protein Q5O89_28550 [Peribacillus frigoritolerans]|nr:hypothetical protein [Peribacillus frigoritolerans]